MKYEFDYENTEVDYTQVHYTGKRLILNDINRRYRCNAARKTVPVMALIGYHEPQEFKELEELIASHAIGGEHENCPCGIRSQGDIKYIASILYDAMIRDQEHEACSSQDCLNFVTGLYIQHSLRGFLLEEVARYTLLKHIKTVSSLYDVRHATDKEDRRYAVDVVVMDENDNIVCGIQVKNEIINTPSMQNEKIQELEKHAHFGHPVYFMLYDKHNKFINIDYITDKVMETRVKIKDVNLNEGVMI